jgi:diguanylate cyclase (GGDEF)-like protein/PAS domain S-box-containing protein
MSFSFRNRTLAMATSACVLVVLVFVAMAAIDLRLDANNDAALLALIPDGSGQIEGMTKELAARRLAEFERRLLVIAAGGLLLLGIALTLAWRLVRRVEGPLEDLRGAVERLSGGDWVARIDSPEGGYGADLAYALDRLRISLADHAAAGRALDIILDSMNDAVFVTSPDGLIKRVNLAATQLLGWSQLELLGRELGYVISDQDRLAFSIERATNETLELTVRTHNGQTIPVSLSGSVIAAEDPRFQGCIFVARNITERKRAERRIRYLARYDTLTKIPNRLQFQHSLQQAIARARRAGGALALMYLDLDRFKEVNDTFGHAAGDRALEVLSERLIRRLPPGTMLGRLAGDEFALLVENLPGDTDNRTALQALARELLDGLGRPFHIAQQELYVTGSIGIAFCPQDADNVVDLIRNADAAMYHSKQNGGNSSSFFTPEMSAVAVERLMLKSKLRRAIERDEFVMLYQPKVDLRDGRVVGGEALLRWRLPGHGDISPVQFIPLAEETALIQEIGEWVLKRVCNDYRSWQDQVPQPGRVSINLSLKQLRQAEFLTRYRSVFDETGVAPANFELEITETTLMTDARRMMRLLDELHAMGLHLSIDDFGTGYSSLSALQQFPVGTLKIDQSFVRHAAVSREDATLVRTIIEMGRNLGLEVVAEGIETPQQLAFLRGLNCHYGQGRLFGEPLTATVFLQLLLAQAQGDAGFRSLFA